MAARTFHSELVSESASTAVLDGAGVIGDLICVADTRSITAAGTTPGARRFTTDPIFTAAVSAAGQVSALATLAGAAEFTTVPAQQPAHSAEMLARPEDTLNLEVRPALARAPLAATIMADSHGAIRREEAGALVAAVWVVAAGTAAAGITNRIAVMFNRILITFDGRLVMDLLDREI
jgi:hypothetical protein